MYPSNTINGNTTSFSNSSIQPRTYSFCNYNHGRNHSKPSLDHYHPPSSSSFHLCYPHYIPLEDESINIIHEISQPPPPPLSDDHHNHRTTVIVNSTRGKTPNHNAQSILDDDKNGNFVTDYGSHVILEKKCLRGKSRSSKKDRHSKINTARGPRDRRMRLSLDVAKKFFRLQDMLGFDKASNTIEWLIMKSKPAIRDLLPEHLNQSCSLVGASTSPSSASECEVVSGIDDRSNRVITIDKVKEATSSCKEIKKKVDRGVAKTVYRAKESREKARARARKRTTEKKSNKLGADGDPYSEFRPGMDQVMEHNVNRLGSWIPFVETQVQTTDQAEYHPSSHFQTKQGIVGGNSSPISSNWSPSFLFNYQHNPGPSHEHQFSDSFQLAEKPWEGNNN